MFEYFYYNSDSILKRGLPLFGFLFFFSTRLKYHYWGKRHKSKTIYDSPLFTRLKAKYDKTFLGKVNLLTHLIFEKFRNKYLVDIVPNILNSPFYSRLLILSKYTLVGMFTAYIINEYLIRNGNIRTYINKELIYHREYQNYAKDISSKFIGEVKSKNLSNEVIKKEINYKLNIAKANSDKLILNKKDPLNDVVIELNDSKLNKDDLELIFTDIDFLQYGKLMSGVLQEEIASQCYYIAYLKNRNIETNSKLKFDTHV